MGMFGRKWEIRRAVRPVVVGTVMHLAPTAVAIWTGGHAHDVVDDTGAGRVLGHGELGVSGHVLLGLGGDTCLHGNGLDRVLAGCGLAGEHHGVGAIEDGVGNVSDLGTRRARVVLHGVEHLRGGDNGL